MNTLSAISPLNDTFLLISNETSKISWVDLLNNFPNIEHQKYVAAINSPQHTLGTISDGNPVCPNSFVPPGNFDLKRRKTICITHWREYVDLEEIKYFDKIYAAVHLNIMSGAGDHRDDYQWMLDHVNLYATIAFPDVCNEIEEGKIAVTLKIAATPDGDNCWPVTCLHGKITPFLAKIPEITTNEFVSWCNRNEVGFFETLQAGDIPWCEYNSGGSNGCIELLEIGKYWQYMYQAEDIFDAEGYRHIGFCVKINDVEFGSDFANSLYSQYMYRGDETGLMIRIYVERHLSTSQYVNSIGYEPKLALYLIFRRVGSDSMSILPTVGLDVPMLKTDSLCFNSDWKPGEEYPVEGTWKCYELD